MDLFQAIAAGQVEARVVANTQLRTKVLLKNATNRPLSVKLPPVLAAEPILAQNFFDFPAQQNDPGPQPLGLPIQQQNGGLPGIFNIPPQQVRKVVCRGVCLEHDAPAPRSSIAYRLRPAADLVRSAGALELLRRAAGSPLPQEALQAAVWHLENGLTWEQLERKRRQVLGQPSRPYFTAHQLREARRLVSLATKPSAAQTAAN